VVLIGDRGHDHAGAHRGDHQTGRSQASSPPCARRRSAALPRPAPFSFPYSFDQRDLAEITSPDYPGERLVACRNPLLADERARKRRASCSMPPSRSFLHIQSRVRRAKKPLRGKDKIALAVGAVINHYKMAKHFAVTISRPRLDGRA